MKKFFAIAFVAAFLVACEEKKADTTTAPVDTTVAPVVDTTAAPVVDTTAAPAADTTKK